MRIFSTYLILFFFAFLAGGGSATDPEPHATKDVRIQPQPPVQQGGGTQVHTNAATLAFRRLNLLLCTHRMLYQNFANIEWVGKWPVPPWNPKDPSRFSGWVLRCPVLINGVLTQWEDRVRGLRMEETKIMALCIRRCRDPTFGGIRMNVALPAVWSEGYNACKKQCYSIYASLKKAADAGEPAITKSNAATLQMWEAFTEADVERAVKVVEESQTEVEAAQARGGGNKAGVKRRKDSPGPGAQDKRAKTNN